MVKNSILFGFIVTAIAAFYQAILKDVVFIHLGVGRTHNKIEDFPGYKCRRLIHPLLESCEDLALDAEGRKVYAACSSKANRAVWMPNVDKFNAPARGKTDHISVLNIDAPGSDSLYGLHTLTIPKTYQSASGNQEIDVLSLYLEPISSTRLRLFLTNNRPPTAGIDAYTHGANSTIEVFELERGSTELEFVRTIFSDAVTTPNNLVGDGNGGVFVTNDHTTKVGKLRALEIFSSGGTVAYCPSTPSLSTPTCTKATNATFNYANGIERSPSNQIFVANSPWGSITILSPSQTSTLETVGEININMPIDNLSFDVNGDLWVPGFPDVLALLKATSGFTVNVPTSVFRVSRRVGAGDVGKGEGGDWIVEKILEDIEGSVLPGATSVIHDVKTGMLWLGGVTSGFIAVCEKVVV